MEHNFSRKARSTPFLQFWVASHFNYLKQIIWKYKFWIINYFKQGRGRGWSKSRFAWTSRKQECFIVPEDLTILFILTLIFSVKMGHVIKIFEYQASILITWSIFFMIKWASSMKKYLWITFKPPKSRTFARKMLEIRVGYLAEIVFLAICFL